MTKPSRRDRLLELVANPPPGSKIEAAKKYGVDLTLNIEAMLLTPTERVRKMEGALRLMDELQRAGRLVPPK
jgi:hypothetical protein